jgi:hypothetical protein
MANVNWTICNALGSEATFSVDADAQIPVPPSSDTEETGSRRAGDLVAGDHFFHSRATMKIVAILP